MPEFEVQWLTKAEDIGAAQWAKLLGREDYPFLQYAFIDALERSGSVAHEKGWQVAHLVLKRDKKIVAIMPTYIKHHSYGEYVFDWSWADAYQRHNMAYYPKLLSAIPFTPSIGPRILALAEHHAEYSQHIIKAIQQRCDRGDFSSWHVLFASPEIHSATMIEREGVQYRWLNRNYQSFDDFLSTFNSRKRKNLRRERQALSNAGVSFETRLGAAISPQDWAFFYHCYQRTYAQKSGHGGYLEANFFEQIAGTMQAQTLMVIAYQNGQRVASALFFRDSKTLYGRYWGSIIDLEFLHFETCYYQGIEFAIEHGLQSFDAGAQGEHKIQRGFEPITTRSGHYIAHPGFADAIARFTAEETEQLQQYRTDASAKLPFKT